MLACCARHLPDVPTSESRRRGDPAARPVGRRRGRGAGVPLVRPRAGAARDRPGAAARRPPRAGLEQPRRADPVGAQARQAARHPGARCREHRARPSALVPVRRCSASSRSTSVPVLAGRSTASRSSTWSPPAATSRRSTRTRATRKLAEVLAFYDDYGRGMDGMQLPYRCECFRAQVIDRHRRPRPDASDDADD